jgi:hypothetical protein
MWLSKLFGTRKREADIDVDEEPARFISSNTHETTGAHPNLKRRTQEALPKASSGFDPYNSGTFKKKENAWERVVRR